MGNIEISAPEVKKLIHLIPSGQTGLLIFDEECVLCNSLIGRLLKSDRHKRLAFSTFSSTTIKENLPGLDLSGLQSQSIVFITQQGVFLNSGAVLEIAATTGGYPVMTRLIGITPVPVRDFIYRIIARYRYRWFGKTKHCIIPSTEDAVRFLH